MRKANLWAGIAVAGVVLLGAQSCDTPSSDRENKRADGYADVYDVTIWRNADDVPNVAMFCVDGMRFASTLSADGVKQPQLVRIPEQDRRCAR